MDKPFVIVVMATYNEEANIKQVLDGLSDYYVIVVDDSTDSTADIAEAYENVRVYRRGGRGIATAYRDGFSRAIMAEPDCIVQMDAGLTHDPVDIARMLAAEGDLVIGARQFSLRSFRSLISLGAAAMMRWLGIPVSDATSGFRCWYPPVLQYVLSEPLQATGFAFQLETLYRAHHMGAEIVEVPIQYTLTNSSFNVAMLVEALRIYVGFRVA